MHLLRIVSIKIENSLVEMVQYLKFLPIVMALFPWVSFGILEMDSQPWPGLVFGVFLLFYFKCIKIELPVFVASFLLACGFLVSIFNSLNPYQFLTIRTFYSFSSFFIIFLGFKFWIEKYGFPLKFFVVVNAIWIFMGLIEFFYPEFKELFLSRRTSPERGMTSFAPEPTFFAIYLIFSSWVIHASGYRPKNVFLSVHFVNVMAILLVSMSTMGLAYLILALFLYALYVGIFDKHLRNYVLLCFFFVLGTVIVIYHLPKNTIESFRILEMVVLAVEMGPSIFHFDKSMNARLESMVFSIQAAFMSGLIPAGVDTFQLNHPVLREWWGGFFWCSQPSPLIMSWIGYYLYTFGIFSFAIFIFIYLTLKNGKIERYFEISFLFLILLSAIPSSFPLIPILVATYAWRKAKFDFLKR